MKTIFILFFLVFSFQRLNAQASPSSGCAPLDVVFTPPSGMSTYYWDFGDGSSSELSNPTNKFLQPQSYVVSLRACKTCPIVQTYSVSVSTKPTITVPEYKGCSPLTVNITPNITLPPSVSITSLKYIFGTGASTTASGSGIASQSYTYTSSGSYNLGFELKTSPSNSNCDVSISIPSSVKTSSITGQISGSPFLGCIIPMTSVFSSNLINTAPIVSYNWNIDGTTSTAKDPPSVQFNSYGVKSASLKVKDENGCERTFNTTVELIENNLTKINVLDTLCLNILTNVSHDASASVSTQWNFSGATATGSVASKNSYVSYSSPGVKTISVTTRINGQCPKTITKNVFVVDQKINYKITPVPLCNKKNTFIIEYLDPSIVQEISWFKMPEGILLSNKIKDTITYVFDYDTITWKQPKSNIGIKVKTKFGCELLFDSTFFHPLIAHVFPNFTEGCAPLDVFFLDRTNIYNPLHNIVKWELIYGDGNRDTFLTNSQMSHRFNNPGRYKTMMIATNNYGCVDTTYLTEIRVGKAPNVDFSININGGCASDPNSSIALTSLMPASDSAQVVKYWGEGFQCFNQPNLTYSPKRKVGVQTITMEASNHDCFSSITKSIYIKGPAAKIQTIMNCDSGRKVNFKNLSEQATSYEWDFAGLGISSAKDTSFTFPSDGDYQVILKAKNDTNSCPPAFDTIQVKIQTPHAKFDNDTFVYCVSNPNKVITANSSSGYINDNLNTGFLWDFYPESIPKRSENPFIKYIHNDTLTKTVILTVRNFMNCTHKDTALLIIDSVYSFPEIDTGFCVLDSVNFYSNVVSRFPITMMRWFFGDGTNTFLTDNDTFHYYTNPSITTYNTTFTAKNIYGCGNVFSKTIKTKNLELTLDAVFNNLCLGKDSLVFLKSNLTYPGKVKWTFGPQDTFIGKEINKKFSALGTYNIQITAIDSIKNNCVDTLNKTITVRQKPKLAILSDKDTSGAFCSPFSLTLFHIDSNNSGVISSTIKWNVLSSLGSQNFAVPSPTTTMPKGQNNVTLSASNAYCADTTQRAFKVFEPKGKMTIDKNNICRYDSIEFKILDTSDVYKFSIDFGDGTYDSVAPLKHSYTYVPLSGSTKAKISFFAKDGFCQSIPFDTTINIREVYANFGRNFNGDTSICYAPFHIKDSSSNVNNYFWDFGDGTTSTQKEPGYHSFPKPDSYWITLKTSNTQYGCKDSISKRITLFPLPKSNPSNDTICKGDTAFLIQKDTVANTSYYWEPRSKFLLNPSWRTMTASDTSFEFKAIAVIDSSGCADTASSRVLKVILPMPSVTFDTSIAQGADVLLPFELYDSYTAFWKPDSFLTCTNCSYPTAQYVLNEIFYEVDLKETLLNCFTGKSTFHIKIFEDIIVNAPTAFTPNGDGNNDVYYARGFGIKKLQSFKIYNRWGQLLFFSQDENNGWDGYYKGALQAQDTYFYTIVGESYIPGKVVKKEGNFLLLK